MRVCVCVCVCVCFVDAWELKTVGSVNVLKDTLETVNQKVVLWEYPGLKNPPLIICKPILAYFHYYYYYYYYYYYISYLLFAPAPTMFKWNARIWEGVTGLRDSATARVATKALPVNGLNARDKVSPFGTAGCFTPFITLKFLLLKK